MGYAGAQAGFGAGFWQKVQTAAAQQTATKTAPAPTAPLTITPPVVSVPPPPGTMPAAQPIQPILPILVAGPAPSSSGGGGGGGGGEFGLAPAAGGTSVGSLLQQPAVLIGIAILGFLALRRGGGTRKF